MTSESVHRSVDLPDGRLEWDEIRIVNAAGEVVHGGASGGELNGRSLSADELTRRRNEAEAVESSRDRIRSRRAVEPRVLLACYSEASKVPEMKGRFSGDEMANRLGLEPEVVASAILGFERRGWVKNLASNGHVRMLTDAGVAAAEEALAPPDDDAIGLRIAPLSPSERRDVEAWVYAIKHAISSRELGDDQQALDDLREQSEHLARPHTRRGVAAALGDVIVSILTGIGGNVAYGLACQVPPFNRLR